MTDRLLGTPPDQITESEKTRRYGELREQQNASYESNKLDGKNVKDGWLDEYSDFEKQIKELERKYPDLPPETPITVSEVHNFGGACPTQLEGKTDDGKEVYVRYRHGYLRVDIDDECFFGKQLDFGEDDDHSYECYLKQWGGNKERAKKSYNSHQMAVRMSGGVHSYAGTLSYNELREATVGWINWPVTDGDGA